MNTIPLFFTPHDLFSVNFESVIVFFLEMKGFIEATWLLEFITLNLRETVFLDILMPMLTLALLEIAYAVANRYFFYSIPIHLSSLAVLFLCL